MLPLSKKPIRFTPRGYEGAENPPTYVLGVPTIAGKAELRRALASAGMRHWGRAEFGQAARNHIEAVRPENAAELIAVLDRVDDLDLQVEPDPDAVAEAERQWDELLSILATQSPEIARMFGDNLHYRSLSPYLSAALFLRGWENVGAEFRRAADGTVAMELLEELPERHVQEIFIKLNELMFVSRGQEKNSGSPSPSLVPQAASAAESERRTAADGTSPETTTS